MDKDVRSSHPMWAGHNWIMGPLGNGWVGEGPIPCHNLHNLRLYKWVDGLSSDGPPFHSFLNFTSQWRQSDVPLGLANSLESNFLSVWKKSWLMTLSFLAEELEAGIGWISEEIPIPSSLVWLHNYFFLKKKKKKSKWRKSWKGCVAPTPKSAWKCTLKGKKQLSQRHYLLNYPKRGYQTCPWWNIEYEKWFGQHYLVGVLKW